jgi:hypothetical protein
MESELTMSLCSWLVGKADQVMTNVEDEAAYFVTTHIFG